MGKIKLLDVKQGNIYGLLLDAEMTTEPDHSVFMDIVDIDPFVGTLNIVEYDSLDSEKMTYEWQVDLFLKELRTAKGQHYCLEIDTDYERLVVL